MASMNSPAALLPESKGGSFTAEENITQTKTSDKGLASLAASPPTEVAKKVEVVQKAQVSSLPKSDKTKQPKEKTQPQKTPSPPAMQPRQFPLEIWIWVEVTPGEYALPEEDMYSANFVMDTLNFAYPGCTGVYLAQASHLVAFYGKKGATQMGLSIEQDMEVCHVIAKIPTWMDSLAKFMVWVVSLQEADDLVVGLKRLEKENYRKVWLELFYEAGTDSE